MIRIKERKYWGWIYLQKEEGFTDKFFVQHEGVSKHVGHGNLGAQAAVDYFDKLAGQPVKLDNSLGFLGLRVYTETESDE